LLFELLFQNPFEENAGGFPKWSFTQSLSMEFESNYSAELLGLGKETGYASPEIDPDLFSFDFEPKEQSVHQNLHTGHASMNAKESLTKVDSFSKWIKEFASVDDLHMQSSPDISWGTDECGNVIDDTSLDLSLSQDQLFSIHDFSPKWAYADSEIEVLTVNI